MVDEIEVADSARRCAFNPREMASDARQFRPTVGRRPHSWLLIPVRAVIPMLLILAVSACSSSPAVKAVSSPGVAAAPVLVPAPSPPTPASPAPGAVGSGAPVVSAGATARAALAVQPAGPAARPSASTRPAAARPAAAAWTAKWKLGGSAAAVGNELQLSVAGSLWSAGSAFWPETFVSASNLSVSFDASMSGGTGADGMTLAVVDAARLDATAVKAKGAPNTASGRVVPAGSNGGGLGWAGLPGFAVALDTFQNLDDPGFNTVGLVTGFAVGRPNHLTWAAADTRLPSLRRGIQKIKVLVSAGMLTVTVNGVAALYEPVTLPSKMLIGFTAGNGRRTDNHSVSNLRVTAS